MAKPTKKDKFFNFFFKRSLHFFPIFFMMVWLYFLYNFYHTRETLSLVAFCLTPYLLPLITFRLVTFFYPIKDGMSYIGVNEDIFSTWLFGFRIQQIYIVFPQFERLLFFLPGMYATWLRLWGSKIGKRVFFVPTIKVHDRSHLVIGDNVVFGDQCYLSSHLLQVRDGRFTLYLKKITIGSNVFIGAMTQMGPGTTVESATTVPMGSYYTVNKKEPQSLMDSKNN